MRLYLLPVMGMCFAVDGLLLCAAGALLGRRPPWGNILLGAAVGALHAAACLLPQLERVSGTFCRLCMLMLMGVIAYGMEWGSVSLFVVLELACGAMALTVEGPASLLISGLGVALLAVVAIRSKRGLVAVELNLADKRQRVMALRDTGNGLRDPITGERVLIIGPEVAAKLTGLSKSQLQSPVETMAQRPLPGLRLVPYTTVNGKGMMLALRLPKVRIGHVQRSALVAFAPEGLGEKGGFEALTGGMV